jgi:methyl-accepting chemotaxis protein
VALQKQIPEASTAKFPGNFPLDNALYVKLCKQLVAITQLVPKASPYTYFRDPTTGKVLWETTYAAFPPQDWAAIYRQPISGIVGYNSEAYRLMVRGLSTTVNQAPYADHSGRFNWISTYTPIRDASGATVAGLGVDYPLSYVNTVRAGAIRGVLPILLISYVLLFIIVVALATFLTRPLKRLTAATARIAEGDYDVDLATTVKTRVPDEMTVLSHSFVVMVDKVRAREQSLTQQVRRLTVEIDAKKRHQSVSEITDSDFFSGIVAKGKLLREQGKGDGAGSSPAGG